MTNDGYLERAKQQMKKKPLLGKQMESERGNAMPLRKLSLRRVQANWPHNKRIAILMAFDVDAECLWTQIGDGNRDHITNLSRGAYGPKTGVPRILSMLDAHAIKATFYVPAWVAEQHPETIREIHRRGHEIAFHGYEHEEKGGATREEEEAIMEKSENIFRELIGLPLLGHRGPGGVLYGYSIEMFYQRGYLYSSNHRDCDGPFFHQVDGKDIPFVELPKDSLYDDGFYMTTFSEPLHESMKTPPEAIRMMKAEFDGLAAEGGRMITFVFHPQLSGHPGRCKALSELIGYMKARGAWFARSDEAARFLIQEHGPFEPVRF